MYIKSVRHPSKAIALHIILTSVVIYNQFLIIKIKVQLGKNEQCHLQLQLQSLPASSKVYIITY